MNANETVITIGTAFGKRLPVEVISKETLGHTLAGEHGQVQYLIRLPSGVESWVAPTSLKREVVEVRSALASFVAADPVTEPGMYAHAGVIFKVQRSKASENLYAKRLVDIGGSRLSEDGEHVVHWEFQYDPGAIRTLTASDRMTVEQARSFGIRFGVCCVCGTTLVDAKSVQAGIGPVCAKRV